MTHIIKIYILGAGELDGTPVVWTGEVVGTAEVVGAITVVAGEAEAAGEAQEGIVVTAVVGAGVIEDSGQLNGAIVEPATFFANGFPERSITGE